MTPCRLDIAVFGAVRISANGQEIGFKSRRARAALGYLVLADGYTATREQLCGLLWGEAATRQAQNSLRQIVRELNRGLAEIGFSGLKCSRLTLSLDPASVSVDLWDALADARQGIAPAVLLDLPHATESLFAGFDDIGATFHAWLRARQQSLHDQFLRELDATLALQGVPPAQRQSVAQAMVNLDPANEAACRALMQARAELGDIAGALRVYENLQKLLLCEHQVPPADATIALLETIKQGSFDPIDRTTDQENLASVRQLRVSDRTAPPRVVRAAPAGGRLGLLVQAFDYSGLADAALIDGFRHDLIGSLVRFREWFIADGATTGPAAVRYTLGATAYANEATVNLVLTLREVDTGVYLWSDRHEIRLDDWFATQDRLVGRVAAALRAQVARARLDALRAQQATPADAYDYWLLAQSLLPRYSANHWNRAVSLFEAAIAVAPGFSPAYSALVQMNNILHIVHPGIMRDPAKTAVTLKTARRAVALDARDSRALLALG